MAKLVNRAKMTTATTGTGTITLGSAVDGYQTFAAAGVANGDTVTYAIEDGVNWEIGSGTYTASGTTLSRTPSASSNSGNAISLSGNAVVFVTADAADLLQPGDNISELTNNAGFTTNTGTVTSVAATAGTGISISGSPITTSGTLTITNTAPDQTVVLTQGANVTITGTYPNFTIASTDTNTTYSAGNGIGLSGTTFSVAAGGGLTQDASGLSHSDTSSQTSVNNSGTTFIQDVTLDTYGHVTSLGSATLSLSSFGVTATSTELNYLDITTLGSSQASKAVTADASGNVKLLEELQAVCYLETVIALSGTSPTVDCDEGNAFTLTTSGNTTFAFSYVDVQLTTNDAYAFTLRVTAGGTHTLTWPASVDWAGGSAPDAPASGETDVYVFLTTDSGINWYGFRAGDAMA